MNLAKALALPLLAITLSTPALARFDLDLSHTMVGFQVEHMKVSTVRGEFPGVSGAVNYDPNKPLETTIDIDIDVASVNTRFEKRDAHLRSPDFFHAEKHPKMKFVSRKVVKTKKKGLYDVVGDLTIRGVTKEVTMKAKLSQPARSPWGTTVVGVHAEATIDRRDFGLTWNKALEKGGVLVGHDVTIEIDAELVYKGDWSVSG